MSVWEEITITVTYMCHCCKWPFQYQGCLLNSKTSTKFYFCIIISLYDYITDTMETQMALRITHKTGLVIVIIAFMTTMVRTESGKYYDAIPL